ncbi:hypothetical protein ACFPOD_03720 [Nitratireductor kimnyeongensis]|uniref:Uncharacterized protein n=1 Tax=Nitratireductor kimnyeongensis TaxID=430679 RepID=A0ABW0T4V6_9HYPH|nr:hypothetical protein [Nitratireductor kimnyeongensis]QZZ34791.1 hypothetical protein KW403_13465 [Nitratireductor kimnyeongensis]
MIMIDVEIRIEKAKADGKRFLLVCADTMDRIKGDKDLGYYYPDLETPEDVVRYISRFQLGKWTAGDLRDHCEAVIELGGTAEPVFHDPVAWLAQHGWSYPGSILSISLCRKMFEVYGIRESSRPWLDGIAVGMDLESMRKAQ